MSSRDNNLTGYIFPKLPLVDQLVAGCVAGGSATIILHPIDLLKTRFQATTTNEYRTLFSVPRQLGNIYHSGGFPALYRGFSANFAGATTSWGLYFLLYRWIQSQFGNGPLAGWQYFLSSGAAGMITVVVANPLWLAKTRLCLPESNAIKYKGLIDCLNKTIRHEGIAGLYRGLGIGLVGTSHGAVQFLSYEKLKESHSKLTLNKPPTTIEFLLMSTSSKIIASLATYPYQVVRCRMQLSPSTSGYIYGSILDVLIQTWRNEGIIGFYKGIVPNTIRVLPGTCITFIVYEKIAAYFKNCATQ